MGRFSSMAKSMALSNAGCFRIPCGLASGFAVLLSPPARPRMPHAQAPAPATPPSAPPAGPTSPPAAGGPAAAAPTSPAAPGPAAPGVATAPNSGVVQRVLVDGNERIERDTILSYLSIQPGDTVGPEQIDVAIKTLF